jgi:hypothetical protein
MENYNALLDYSYQNLEANEIAEFEAWIDSQEIRYPQPIDFYLNSEGVYLNSEGSDPNYEDDF